MRKGLLLFILLCLLLNPLSYALSQELELIFTRQSVDEAMAYRDSLEATNVSLMDALALRELSGTRQAAYLNKVSPIDVVVIVEDGAP